MKTIIGLDPGSERSSFVLWNGKEILDKGILPNEELRDILIDDYCDVASIAEDIVLAIEEMISIPEGGGKAICKTIWWSGRFYDAWRGQREMVPVHVIRKALCAKDNTGVMRALIQRFGEPGTKKNSNPITYGLRAKGYHLWRAFAVAVVWQDHLAFQGKMLK